MTRYFCCLCLAAGEQKEGQIRPNEHVPLCAVHRFELRCKRREPPQGPPAPIDLLDELAGRAAIVQAHVGDQVILSRQGPLP
jgi:hypothetical protein